MDEDLQEVIGLAKKIRFAFELLSKKNDDDDDLTGYCRRASVQLLLAGKEINKDIKITASHHHCFNIYKGYIIDITATQFGKKKPVWVVKASSRNLKKEWRPKTLSKEMNPICNSIKELFSNTGWYSPKHQIDLDKKFIIKYILLNT